MQTYTELNKKFCCHFPSTISVRICLQDDTIEESGWKLVHGDVFRPPRFRLLLTACVGSGVQLFAMVLITLGTCKCTEANIRNHWWTDLHRYFVKLFSSCGHVRYVVACKQRKSFISGCFSFCFYGVSYSILL